jgi:prephenate dehydrogenase
MEHLRKIAIIGVGMIGGSIGGAVKKRRLADRVVGFFRDPKKTGAAIGLGCIDEGTGDLKKAVAEADLIILASPVDDIIAKLRLLKRFIPPKTLVTDAGSTKVAILKAGRGLNFVGSHPLAGSEFSGLRHASADLFDGSLCVIVPDKKPDKDALKRVEGFWRALGSRTIIMNAWDHDAALSFSSHLPHAAAFALMRSVPDKFFSFAAGGLKDTTRIARSSPEVWSSIFLSNRKNILTALKAFEKSLRACRAAIKNNDKKKLLRWLTDAQRQRITAFDE